MVVVQFEYTNSSSKVLLTLMNKSIAAGIHTDFKFIEIPQLPINPTPPSPCYGKYIGCNLTLEEIITWTLFLVLMLLLMQQITRCFRAALDPYNAIVNRTFFRYENGLQPRIHPFTLYSSRTPADIF